MLILHVSDTHLGAMPYGLISRARDIYEAFRETIDIALKERVSLYIHAGDFFDTPNPPPEAYIIAYRGLKKLKEANIKVVAVAGQHDIPKRHAISPLYLLQDLGLIDMLAIDSVASKVFEYGSLSITVYGVSYGLKKSINKINVSKQNDRNILIAHLLLKELGIPSEEADVSLNHIPDGFMYIAMGDYHIKTELKHLCGAPAIYPGATEIHKENECCDKFVALVDLSAKEPIINFIKLKSVRPWIKISCVNSFNCTKELSEKISSLDKNVKRPIVYVEISNTRTENVTKLLDEMVNKRLVEYYRVKVIEKGNTIENGISKVAEMYEYIDLDKIVQSLVKHEGFAQLLSRYLKEPTKQMADDIIQFLKNNTELVKALESRYEVIGVGGLDIDKEKERSVNKEYKEDFKNRGKSSLLTYSSGNK